MRNWFIGLFIITLAHQVYAYRIPRPPILRLPLTQDQISKLNDTLEDIWNLQNGEFNLDIVTSSKTNAANGDIWILNDSGTYKLEFKAGGSVHTITP